MTNRLPAPNFIGHQTGNETYFFIYDDNQQAEMLDIVCEWAANPELNFSESDAIAVVDQMRVRPFVAEAATDFEPEDLGGDYPC